MLIKNLLALLLAGLAVVTATNSSSSSSDTSTTNGTSSSSSSDTTGVQNSGNGSSSSSSTTGGGAMSSSSSSSTTGGGAQSSSSSSSTTGGGNPAQSSSSSSSTTGGGNPAQSSSSSSTAGGNGNSSDTATTASAHQASGKLKATMKLATGTTTSDLMNSDSYVEAWRCAIAEVAVDKVNNKCDISKVSITGFTFASRRQLTGNSTATESKTISASFVITYTTATLASGAAAKFTGTSFGNTQQQTFMARLSTGSNAGGTVKTPMVGTNSIVVDTSAAVTVDGTISSATVTYQASGAWKLDWYTDAMCTTDSTDVKYTEVTDGVLGGACKAYKAGATANNKALKLDSCAMNKPLNGKWGSACGSVSDLAGKVIEGVCHKEGTMYYKISCDRAAGTGDAASDAASKSVVGVIMGLLMGLVSLV